MIPAPFKVVLDACVLYPFTVRDVLLQAAAQGFYQVYWSEMILDEALRNLISDGRMTEDDAAKLVAVMARAFPEAQVTDHEALIPSMRNDEKDRHVAAAAVKAGAQVIVTSNTRDFHDLPSGIDVQPVRSRPAPHDGRTGDPGTALPQAADGDPPHRERARPRRVWRARARAAGGRFLRLKRANAILPGPAPGTRRRRRSGG